MRIVGGTLGGRRFQPPARMPARPTTDLAREGLFNILSNMLDMEDITAADLFSGTGSIAYELASRGASRVLCVEADAASASFIKKTADQWNIANVLDVVKADVFRFIEKCTDSFDLIIADPPYAHPRMGELPDMILKGPLLNEGGILVLEHDGRHSYETQPYFTRVKAYGDTRFSFFHKAEVS